MKFRGLDPRTRWLRWGLAAIALGIVIGATGPQAADALVATWETNRSMLPWVFERLFAFLAYFAMAGSVVYGLLLSTKILDVIAHRPITFALHQDLASVGLGLAAVHGMLLALDKTVPFTLAQIAVPGLAPYAPIWVAAGQVAFYLMAASSGASTSDGRSASEPGERSTTSRSSPSSARPCTASWPGRTAALRGPGGIYVGATIAVVFLLVYRIGMSLSRRQPAAGPRDTLQGY